MHIYVHKVTNIHNIPICKCTAFPYRCAANADIQASPPRENAASMLCQCVLTGLHMRKHNAMILTIAAWCHGWVDGRYGLCGNTVACRTHPDHHGACHDARTKYAGPTVSNPV